MISNHMTGLAMMSLPKIVLGLLGCAFRETAAAASCGVLVDRAALARAVEDARRLGDRALSRLAALGERVARGLHRGPRGRAGEGLDRGASLRLTDALECGTLPLLRCH